MDTKDRLDQENSKINVTNSAITFRRFWWVYLIVFAGFMTLAYLYCKVKAPKYDCHTSIILNDSDDLGKSNLGGLGSLMASFSMGGSGYKYIDDEISRIKSHSNLLMLIKDLRLNENYSVKYEFLSPRQFYFNDSPINVFLPEQIADTISVNTMFNIMLAPDGKTADITAIQPQGAVFNKTGVSLPAMIKTPYGTFRVALTSHFTPGKPLKLRAIYNSPNAYTFTLYRNLKAKSPSKKSSLIFIDYLDENPKRGMAILDGLVDIYNRRNIQEYQDQARVSIDFIKGRLEKLYNDLEVSERNIETYKRANNIAEPEAEAEYLFKKKQVIETGMIEYETRYAVLKMILEFLRNDDNRYSLVPFAEDLPKEPVAEYNEFLIERLRLIENAKGNNASLKTVNAQADAMRANLITSLERQMTAAQIAISDMKRSGSGSSARIAQIPTIEKNLLSLYRDQKIKNQIYAYLLQKLEESELKLAREINTGKYVDVAYAEPEPSSPKKSLIYIGAALGSILCSYAGLMMLLFIMKMVREIRSARKE